MTLLWEISSKRQENGMWGTPMCLYAMEGMPPCDDEKMLIHSATVMACAEKFNHKSFKAIWHDNNGFAVEFNHGEEPRWIVWKYNELKLVDTKLYLTK